MKRRGAIQLGVFALIIFWAAFGESSVPFQTGDRHPFRPISPPDRWAAEPAEILTRVYEMSQGSPSYERAFLLMDLGRASLRVNRTLAAKSARDLFQVSLMIPPEWKNYRYSSQMTAVRMLAEAGQVTEAVELFDQMELQAPSEEGEPVHDLRHMALVALFPRLIELDRREGLEWAERQLTRLSATGVYPYSAASDIIQELLIIQELFSDEFDQAQSIYGRAIAHFRGSKDKEIDSARDIFVRLLLRFDGKFLTGLERQGVTAAVDAIMAATPPDKERKLTRVTLEDERSVILEGRQSEQLFKLLPLLAKYEPERAQKLVRQKQQLQPRFKGESTIKDQRSVTIVGTHDDSPQKLDEHAVRQLAWQRSQKAGEIAAESPNKALRIAKEIAYAAPRAAALAGMARSLAKEDPERARTLVADSQSLLEKVEEPSERLRLLTVILRAYVSLENTKQVADTYTAILDLGTELAEQELSSDPTFPLFVTGSFQQLSMATESAAQIEPEARLAEISTLDNNQLQWHLMIAVARALAKNDSK